MIYVKPRSPYAMNRRTITCGNDPLSTRHNDKKHYQRAQVYAEER